MQKPDSSSAADVVVLLHGLAAHRIVMRVLQRSLSKSFAEAINWSYPSIWSPIEHHGRQFAAFLKQLDAGDQFDRIHLVTHSMGGIVARQALAEYLPTRLGRCVMIAPPNRGSAVAARLAPWLGRLVPPLGQLADDANSFVCTLPPPAFSDLGIIAARGDCMVREASTRLGCEVDHIVLPGLHSSLLWRRETAEQVRYFLEHGSFWRAAAAHSA